MKFFLLAAACFLLGSDGQTPPAKPPAQSKQGQVQVQKKKQQNAKGKKATVAKAKPAPPIQAPSLPAKLEAETEAEKKLDGNLLEIVRASRSGVADAAGIKAKSLKLLDSATNLMKVEITATEKAKVEAVKQAVEAQKGKVLVDLENHIFAMVPAGSVEELAKLADVFSISVVSESLRQ